MGNRKVGGGMFLFCHVAFIFMAQTLYSGMSAMGSVASFVRMLAAASL